MAAPMRNLISNISGNNATKFGIHRVFFSCHCKCDFNSYQLLQNGRGIRYQKCVIPTSHLDHARRTHTDRSSASGAGRTDREGLRHNFAGRPRPRQQSTGQVQHQRLSQDGTHQNQSTGQGEQETSGNLSLAAGIAGFALSSVALAFSFWKEDKVTIEKVLAKALIAERENRLGDADKFFHQATVMSAQENNNQALLFTYDQMANFNMRHGRLTKAENLFKETLRLLLSSGMAREDPAVVEISLKLARIYEQMGRNEEADIGFKWCIEISERLLKQMPDDSSKESHAEIINLKSLLGMCLDSYARFLGATNRLAQAEKLYKRALEICEGDLNVDGMPHPQTVILLNDLGTVCDMQGHYDQAAEYVLRASQLAEKLSPSDLPTILCNLASIEMHKGKKEESRKLYKRALRLAEKYEDREATIVIRANLQKVL